MKGNKEPKAYNQEIDKCNRPSKGKNRSASQEVLELFKQKWAGLCMNAPWTELIKLIMGEGRGSIS